MKIFVSIISIDTPGYLYFVIIYAFLGGLFGFCYFLLLSIDGVLFSINTYKWLEYLFFK